MYFKISSCKRPVHLGGCITATVTLTTVNKVKKLVSFSDKCTVKNSLVVSGSAALYII